MNSIKKSIIYKQEINKSTFITELYKVNNTEEVKKYLTATKEKYKDATHYCYAYIIDDQKKSSDDGEPGGTAGVPIMEVLLKNDLNYILCVVIRYFGGIKLGAGGLVRAYSSSISNALSNSKIVKLYDGYKITFEIDYKSQSKVDYLLRKYTFSKVFNQNIKYTLLIKKEDINILKDNNIDYEILENIKVEE